MSRVRLPPLAAAAAVALLLSVLHTWPLATAPGRLSLHYNADVMLNEWIVTWIQHQLPRAPGDLFAGNIFHPAPDVLAFSEPLIVPALLGAPMRMAGASPVLVHNLLLLSGLTLSVLAGYALIRRWTGDPLAGILGGSAFAFNTHMLARIEHLQAMHAYPLPLAMLAADHLVITGRARYAFGIGGALLIAAYTSGYLVVQTLLMVAVVVAVRAPEWWHARRAVLGGLSAAAAATIGLVLPLAVPYRRAATEQGMGRGLEHVYQFSAAWDGFFASYSRLHHALWNAGAPREFPDAFFPGVVVLGLAAAACVAASRRTADAVTRRRVLSLAVIAALGAILAVGTRTPVYGWLYEVFPPMRSLRAGGRFGFLFLFAMAVLAGFGLGILRSYWRGRAGAAIALVLILVVHAEAARAPFNYLPYRGIVGPYPVLADTSEPVVLVEVPFYPPDVIFQNGEYVFNSTAHWRRLMNGYSGYTPRTYRKYSIPFREFPDAAAVEAMQEAGVTHVMLHPRRFGSAAESTLRAALAHPDLERLAAGADGVTLFRLRRR